MALVPYALTFVKEYNKQQVVALKITAPVVVFFSAIKLK